MSLLAMNGTGWVVLKLQSLHVCCHVGTADTWMYRIEYRLDTYPASTWLPHVMHRDAEFDTEGYDDGGCGIQQVFQQTASQMLPQIA